MKIGDFVQVITGIGCAPKFGYIRSEGTLKAFNLPVWIVQTGVNKEEAVPKDYVRQFKQD